MTAVSLDSNINMGNVLLQMSNLTAEQINENIANISALLSSMGIENVFTEQLKDTGNTTAPYSKPELGDDGEDGGSIELTCSDLEKVIAQLQAECDEEQLRQLQESLKNTKTELSSNYSKTMDKINKSVEEAKEQERQRKASRFLGIFGAILAIAMAVAVTIVTGGVAAGFAIAGAVVAVAQVVMDFTGGDKALMKAIEDSIKKTNPDLGKAEREAAAGAAYAAIFLAMTIITAVGTAFAPGKAIQGIAQSVQKVMQMMKVAGGVAGAASGVAGATLGFISAAQTKKTADAQAEVTEMQAALLAIQKLLEEQNDIMEELLSKLGDVFGAMMSVMNNTTDTSNDILQFGRQMA